MISLVSRLVNNFKFSSYDVGKWRRGDVEYVGDSGSKNSSGGVSFLGRYRLVEIGNIRGRDGNDCMIWMEWSRHRWLLLVTKVGSLCLDYAL